MKSEDNSTQFNEVRGLDEVSSRVISRPAASAAELKTYDQTLMSRFDDRKLLASAKDTSERVDVALAEFEKWNAAQQEKLTDTHKTPAAKQRIQEDYGRLKSVKTMHINYLVRQERVAVATALEAAKARQAAAAEELRNEAWEKFQVVGGSQAEFERAYPEIRKKILLDRATRDLETLKPKVDGQFASRGL